MSYTPTPIEQAARGVVVQLVAPVLLARQVIYENQDALRPGTSQMATVLVTTDDEVGVATREVVNQLVSDEAPEGELYEERLTGDRVISIRVTCYGPTSYQACQRITRRWQLDASRARAAELGLALLTVSGARRVPLILSQVTEDRWAVDITAHHRAVETDAVPAVETASATFSAPT